MVTNCLMRLAVICTLLALLSAPAAAQQPGNSTAPKKESRQSEGLLDFALKKVNPSDQDYGKCIDDGRKVLLEETIENGYFWSNLFALGLLGCFLLVIIHQLKRQQRREMITAKVLAQYQNALTRADVQIKEATSRNRALMEALSLSIERAVPNDRGEQQPRNATTGSKDNANNAGVTTTSLPSVIVQRQAPGRSRQQPNLVAANAPVSPTVPNDGGGSPTRPRVLSPAQSSTDVDLVAKVNQVQQQLTGSQEREKQLRRQLNDAELRLQKEQQKNRSLKGE